MSNPEIHIELEMVNQIKSGNVEAFERLYDNYSKALFGVSSKIVRSDEIAEDVLQEAFVKIWKKIHSYDASKGRLFTWMLNIVRNTSIDKLRKLKSQGKYEIQELKPNVDLGVNNSKININHIGVKDLLAKLSPEQQEMIEYLYFNGYTQQEVSDELNIPLGTVKTRSRAALKELKKIFNLFLFWI